MTLRIQLEVSTRCNSNCLFCPRAEVIESGKRREADIEWQTLERIVESLSEFNRRFKWISISGLGEPLIYPRLVDAIKLIKSRFRKVPLKTNTNALLLRGQLAERIIGSGLDRLICSLNLADEEPYGRYKNLDFNVVRDNIIDFLRAKGNRRPAVYIRVNAFDVNRQYIREARRFWKRHLNRVDRFSLGRFSNWAGKIRRESFVKHAIATPRHPCKFLHEQKVITISLEGYVFPCCVAIAENSESFLCLGNVKEESIEELYYSKRMETLRSYHKKGRYPPPCNECDSWGPQVENLDEFR